MQIREVLRVPDEALPLQTLKDHLRLGSGFSDDGGQDAILRSWLRASLAAIERRIDKALILRSFVLELAVWRSAEAQSLPLAPVQEVQEVRLFDASGASSILPSTHWVLEPDAQCPKLRSRRYSLPAIAEGGRAEVEFLAGFGPFTALPADLAQAVLMLAAQYHDHRHEGVAEVSSMPFGVAALLEPWRRVRLLGARA